MDDLLDYCSSQPGVILVPIEVLSARGLDATAAEAYVDRAILTRAECERIDTMIRKYCERAAKLGRASRNWFPPRVQHLCFVTNGTTTRPYFQPFHASSWLLYREDLGAETSSLEFGIFLLFQAERQYLQQQIGASLLTNLPYLLILNDAQVEDFVAGCRRSTRPDADGYRALADALPAVRQMHHDPFRRPTTPMPDAACLANGLVVTPEQQRQLDALHSRWMQSVESVVSAHRSSVHSPSADAGAMLIDWLESEAPHLVLAGNEGELLWQGPGTGSNALSGLLARLSPEAERSILADLNVIDRKSRRFLASLSSPEQLAKPASWMTEGGLSFIHGETLRIGYSLTDDPDRLWQVSPPYERLMLAARTIHEWGHQAAESGWVRVDPERGDERARHEARLVECLDRIVDRLPGSLKPALMASLRTDASVPTPGHYLFDGLMKRIDDYMANFVARHFLTAEEMDTYVRNNVGSRVLDYAPEQALTHLLRMGYEYQYLGLSSIAEARPWFLKSTWFESLFVETGIVTVEAFFDLVKCISDLCDDYSIDPARIDLGRSARGRAE